MKKALLIIATIAITGYLIFSATYIKDKPQEGICTGFEVVIKNTEEEEEQFIEANEIRKIVIDKGLDPSNKQLSEINTILIEEAILANKHIKKAEVFITNKQGIRIVLEERTPIIRIMTESGESYYIDNDGKRMPLSRRFTAYLPIATGNVKESFAKDELYKFALFLQKNKFWNAQIEQIIVTSNNEVEFIPRVGEQRVILGTLDNYEDKLEKLMNFYEDGQNRIGWNKYSAINLKYNKQVVCTKR